MSQDRSSGSPVEGPIGVFDSGIGGVSILRALRRHLPAEEFLYLADSGQGPYGDLGPERVRERALRCAEVLEGQGAKALVVACNTATALAVEVIRSRFPGPVVAVEPPLKPAAADPGNRVVGVLVTRAMAESLRYGALAARYGVGLRIHTRPCPGLVECIESGTLETIAGRHLLSRLLEPLTRDPVDTLVLGCTHYAFAEEPIRRELGRDVRLVEPSEGVARQLLRRLRDEGLLNGRGPGGVRFWASGQPGPAEQALRTIAGLESGQCRGAPMGEFQPLAVSQPAAASSA
ncbi:MAG TPA: glutamate racemase [Gammaproteobacteria bacterium]|nr:glutamate racemase [Gammaproteobacteria bacterium]